MYKIEKKKHAVISLWDKTNKLAKKENKTPVVVLCQKNRKGFWIIVKDKDIKKLSQYGKNKNYRGNNNGTSSKQIHKNMRRK